MGTSTLQQQAIHLVFGTDEGMVREKASGIFAALTEGTNEFSHEILEAACGDSDEADQVTRQVMEALRTLPFFPGRKVVWMKNCNFLGDSVTGRSSTTEAALDSLRHLLEAGLGPDVLLLISATEFDKRRSFNKFLLQSAAAEELNKPDITKAGWEGSLMPLINKEAGARGMNFDSAALELFIHRVSESSRQIISEIEKLDLYLGADRRTVMPEDVERMVPLTRTGVIFEISRALENKKSDAAISLIDFQLERGENAVTIMRAAFIPTLRNLLAARLLCDAFNLKPTNFKEFTARISSLPSYAAALIPLKKDGTPNAYPLFLAAQNASKFKTERLKQTLKECMKADKALVSSSLDPRLILHRLAICSAS
ncbi:MAG: DNA polymerase III subunit delta [Akkermansia sp.]|nr:MULTISPECIES: DNA polymerase III subunit delta [Akkermansia]MBO1688980.1 DNA polymerase III subunit delta [Akkermansia sp. GGCC_0220]QWP74397.1 DNA polymerase III subunit delta [Akkermansia massiliensis]GKI06239.1 DNA polymerase III subunit delta [Akkermansia muciniphila]GKI08865.1 DNA polymerase III subunit delta [Akkermansia muciniphila]